MARKYGFFNTSFSAENAIEGSIEQSQLAASEAGLFWLEQRSAESGRSVLMWRNWAGALQELTPKPWSVRSSVYEYGGKSWCSLDSSDSVHIAFVNGDDQQIYLQSISGIGPVSPVQLTHEDNCRYGDLLSDWSRQRIIAVQEKLSDDPTQPEHSLVAICLKSGEVSCLCHGEDFYASPTLDIKAQQLAWISWTHPNMSWVKTSLSVAALEIDGSLIDESVRELSEDHDESFQQPRFTAEGSLAAITDSSGWWNLYRYSKRSEASYRKTPLWPLQADFGIAQWQFGVSTWDWLTLKCKEGGECYVVSSYLENGKGFLAMRHESVVADSQQKDILLATEFSLFRYVSCFNEKIYCVAYCEDRTPAILEIVPNVPASEQVRILSGCHPIKALARVSRPQSISYPVGEGEVAHGFLYLPDAISESESKPPLLVFTHGGPTATTYATFSPKIQYWTERGFAVVDLNYRGSAGFGRDYRLRLEGQWGVTDVEDVVAAAEYLSDKNVIDRESVFIRGGSAGGYTTLCALAFSNAFRGGASYYGVSDLMSLAKDTHKFESHYLDWLIGDPERDLAIYQARSPLLEADKIKCPMIFFQGGKDKVVVPDQTERMVAALKNNGVDVEYHCYPEERHGFRNHENQVHSLEAECAFYQGLLQSSN